MSKDTQLPAEVVDQINNEAEVLYSSTPQNSASYFNDKQSQKEGYRAGATAYAIKLNQAQQLLREADTQLSYISSFVDSNGPAMNLLSRIKTFLDGK